MTRSQPQKSQILIVDDHPLFREGLQQMIARTADLKVCGEAEDAPQALEAIPKLKPDLVLVDISLGSGSGIDLVKAIKSKHADLPVLVVSMHDESLYAERSLRAGAMGYVMKHERGKKVREAIYRVLGGDVYLSEKMSISLLSKLTTGKSEKPVSPLEMLSNRELEVFCLLGQAKGTRKIAEELNLNIATINTFRARIKEKLQLKTSMELLLHATQWFRENGGK